MLSKERMRHRKYSVTATVIQFALLTIIGLAIRPVGPRAFVVFMFISLLYLAIMFVYGLWEYQYQGHELETPERALEEALHQQLLRLRPKAKAGSGS